MVWLHALRRFSAMRWWHLLFPHGHILQLIVAVMLTSRICIWQAKVLWAAPFSVRPVCCQGVLFSYIICPWAPAINAGIDYKPIASFYNKVYFLSVFTIFCMYKFIFLVCHAYLLNICVLQAWRCT